MGAWVGVLSTWFNRVRGPRASTSGTVATTGGSVTTDPVVVWRAANWLEAQIVKGRLESEGIPVLLRGEALGPLYGLTTGGLAEVDLLVPEPLAERAQALLRSLEAVDEADAALEEGNPEAP